MKALLTIIICLFISTINKAQTTNHKGRINGIVLDETSKKSVEFCTVSLLRQKDSTIANGVLGEENGTFKFEQIANGNYIVKAAFVGYENYFSAPITISDAEPNVKLRPFLMKLKMMKTVEIVAEKATMQIEPDKKVFNVDKSVISQGGTAADVLKNVPTINVDADGNMNLRGSDNITIYIDGRQSAQMGSNPTQALQNLPASMIEKIEIITNPSSKYEASGNAGIINIITKKNGQQGFNGSVTAGFGDNDKVDKINKFNNSLLLNYQKNKVNIYTNYSYRYDTRTGYGIFDLDNFYNPIYKTLNQNSTSLNLNRTHNIKAGIDYTISKSLTAGISASRNFGSKNEDEQTVFFNQNTSSDTTAKHKRTSGVVGNSNNFDAAFFIKKTFKKQGHSLSFDANISDNINDQKTYYSDYGYNLIERYYYSNPIAVTVTQPTHNTTYNGQTDYTNTINSIKFESGLRFTNRIIDNTYLQDTSNYVEVKKHDNNFTYNEKVSATYVSGSRDIQKFKLKAGLRAENTDYTFNQKSLSSSFERHYLSIFPTASASTKLKNQADVSLSYSKRINRPSTNNLNPLPDIANPTNIMKGNPDLKPVFIHALEANYSKFFGQQFVLVTAYMRRQVNNIQRYKTIDSLGIGTVTFLNLNNSTNYGAEFVLKNQITSKYDVTSNINVFEQQLNGANIKAGLNNRNFAATFRVIFNAKLPKEINLQLTGSYNTPTRSILGYIKPMGGLEAGIRKDFLNHKLSTSLSFNDIFNTQRFRLKLASDNFTQNMTRKRETRIIQFSLSYRFGQADSKKMKQQLENQDKQNQNNNMDMF